MQYYRPGRGHRVVNKKRIALFSVAVAVAVVAIIFCAVMFSEVKLTPEKEQELFTSGVFEEGVSVEGVALGGLTYVQGEEKVKALAESMVNENHIEFSVREENYAYSLPDAGVSLDYEPQLKEAMLHGREGTRWDLTFGKSEEIDFPLEYAFDANKANALVDADSKAWGEEAIDASFGVDTVSDEDSLTTSGSLVKQEAQDGWKVNAEEIKNTIKNQVESKSFAAFEVHVEVLKGSDEMPQEELVLMGKASTKIGSSSSKGRKYNIWKISDKLNGAVFKPGDVFSVNDYVGDRTESLGWALAPGIENGTYTDQAGGGICQVSSTMYNAALKAEMDIVARLPHTIMATYVPDGMDATISTGGPDFKVKNPLDTNMVMIVKCDIPSSSVTVEIYGTKQRDYYLKFESVLEGEEPLPQVQYKTNSALGKYEVKPTKVGQPGTQYTIYAQKIDKETEKPIGDKYKVTTSTYRASAPVCEVGEGIPIPAEGTSINDTKALAKELEAAENEANNPQPTPSPEATPSQESTQPPEPTSSPEPQNTNENPAE